MVESHSDRFELLRRKPALGGAQDVLHEVQSLLACRSRDQPKGAIDEGIGVESRQNWHQLPRQVGVDGLGREYQRQVAGFAL